MIIDNNTTVEEVKEKTKSTLKSMCNIESVSEKSTTGDSIRKIMGLKLSRVSFSEYDFMRLFFAYVRINGEIIIDKDSLRYDLYTFYNDEKYRELFQDIAVKHPIEGNFLDIEEALLNSVFGGLLSYNITSNSSKRVILIDINECQAIINEYDENYVEKMKSLTNDFLENKYKKVNEAHHFDGKVKTLKNKVK